MSGSMGARFDWRRAAAVAALLALTACDNSPWPKGAAAENTIYSAMIENTPRHLDPTASDRKSVV